MNRWSRINKNSYAWLYIITYVWIISFVAIGMIYFYFHNEEIMKLAFSNFVFGAPLILGALWMTRDKRDTCRKINSFIISNDYYIHHIRHSESGGKSEVVDYYPKIYYIKKDSSIELKFMLDGTPTSEKLKNVEEQLESVVGGSCIGMERGNTYIIYKFDVGEHEQNIIDMNYEIPNLTEGIIPLSGDISWDWYKVPHFLLTGLTGSGKTMLAKYIIRCLVEEGCKVYYCDPKNDIEMSDFIKKTSNAFYVSSEQEIYDVVKTIELEMRERQKDLDTIGMITTDFAPLYLIFDEMIAFSKIADRKVFQETENRLGSIATMGRGKKTFIGIIMQRCDTKFIDGVTRENLCCKIAMGQQSDIAYEMIFGEEFKKIKNSNQKIGSGIIFRSGVDTRPREFYSPYLIE